MRPTGPRKILGSGYFASDVGHCNREWPPLSVTTGRRMCLYGVQSIPNCSLRCVGLSFDGIQHI